VRSSRFLRKASSPHLKISRFLKAAVERDVTFNKAIRRADWLIVRGSQSAYMSRCQQVVPEGKDDKPQRPGELVPLHNVVALLVVLPSPSRLSAT
jgi:hypothetical protein